MRLPHLAVVKQVIDQEPSDSRCSGALAQRRRQKTRFYVTHAVTGARHQVNTPPGTFHPERLVRAWELVKSGQDPEAISKLIDPYRLDGPNPRPDVLRAIFAAMFAVGGLKRTPN